MTYAILLCFSGVRPFGVSLLIAGWDDDRPYLFQCDPSVSFALACVAGGIRGHKGPGKLEIPPAQKLSILSSPAAG